MGQDISRVLFHYSSSDVFVLVAVGVPQYNTAYESACHLGIMRIVRFRACFRFRFRIAFITIWGVRREYTL